MRSVTAQWTDKIGQTHKVGYYHRGSGEDRDDHITVASIVVVTPSNPRKKEPNRGKVFVIKSFRFWHRVAKAILVPLDGGADVSVEIRDLRLATAGEVKTTSGK